MTEYCGNCKWYGQDDGDFELRIEAYFECRKRPNMSNLKQFPFQHRLECYESKEVQV